MEKKSKPILFVTIPAFNEAKSIATVIKSVPRKLGGVGKIKILVWDDGSTDETGKTALQAGADYVFHNKRNLGLAGTFVKASRKACELGAEIVVNTDADNQYDQEQIEKLVRPIIEGRADLVSGDRQVEKLKHMPKAKKYGNMLGTRVVGMLAGAQLKDASSGFRAYTREVIESMIITSSHTYTHETLIQAVRNGFLIIEVPVKFRRRKWGESKLITGIWQHVKLSMATIIRTVLLYEAFNILVKSGVVLLGLGSLGIVRFGYFYMIGEGAGHVQSLILASIVIGVGFNVVAVGIIADLVKINRKLIRDGK